MASFIDKFRPRREIGGTIDTTIRRIASLSTTKTVLLLGDDGFGYSQSMNQIAFRRHQPTFQIQPFRVFINEHQREKFSTLRTNYGNGLLNLFNGYPVDEIMTETMVKLYYSNDVRKEVMTLEDALNARKEESDIFNRVQKSVIATIKDDNDIERFDLVICDGTWFSGDKIWNETMGSLRFVLFDIDTIKNGDMFALLSANGDYERVAINSSIEQDNEQAIALFEKS